MDFGFYLELNFLFFLNTEKIPERLPLQTQTVSTNVLHFRKPSVSNNSPEKARDHGDDESDYTELVFRMSRDEKYQVYVLRRGNFALEC